MTATTDLNTLTSEYINEIALALSKAQAEVRGAAEDKENPHFKSSYSSLSSVWEACREATSKNGLAVTQIMTAINDQLVLVTLLMHSSGQWIKSILPVSSVKSTPQALGSAITYMKRYSLAALVGVCSKEDDDDGELAQSSFNDKKNGSKPIAFPANQMKKEEKPLDVPEKPLPGYDEFCASHNILEGTEIFDYVKTVAQANGSTFLKIINSAIKNPERFDTGFQKWYAGIPDEKKTTMYAST